MVRSIRNIGVVSLGLRIASGLFGQLRSLISSYVSQNEALNASVTSLKNQLGQALAPAINVVIAAMERLMPIVTAVANAVNSVLTALLGKVGTTTAAITASAEAAGSVADSLQTYGFDQITKVSTSSGSSSGSSVIDSGDVEAQSQLAKKLEYWTRSITTWLVSLKNAFQSGDWELLGQQIVAPINKAFDSLNVKYLGSKIGNFADNLITVMDSALSAIDFTGIGSKIGQIFTDAIRWVDWSAAGRVIGEIVTAIPSMLVGFIQDTDWMLVAKSLGDMLIGALSNIGGWIQEVDWLKLGDCVWKFIANIDYAGIFKELSYGLGSILGAAVEAVVGFFDDAFVSLGKFFAERIQRCGNDWAAGLLLGILEGLGNIVVWLTDNILVPLVEGFKNIFGIHSPSTVMAELGGYLSLGVLEGFKEKWQLLVSFLAEGLASIKSKLTEAWTSCKTATSQKWAEITSSVSGKLSELKSSASEKLQNIRQAVSDAWTNMTSDAATAASNIASKAVAGFQKMKQGVIDTFSGMWSGVKSWINKIIGGVESMVNFVISGINGLIDSFNRIADVGEYFGLDLEISRLATVTLPRLAEGGIADGPTAAIIGEAGKEAVLPLENNTGWMDKLIQKIVEVGGGSGTPVVLQFLLGNRKITEYVIKDINQITKTTGVCPIKV